ncbi:MAG: hypothetical protein A2070_14790 [Bdellovibrionales bacterium GWC1_52_8]|nr:MAG: hypothetical protein A2Z97_12825 [Bdellovibrionales bacterium GWB1_52_6]OFZ02834.1 MAG: hypothetical protein A2X97_04475 [Bdellovibrionales bacterium GWA1_52_35]OFZ33492.1 MAG: hypothetical protein A2070_14790 [Bdellovibrionales bacterium GWC1_52_8]
MDPHTENLLKELYRDFQTILETTTDFIYFKDKDSRIRFCSQTLARICGFQHWREMIGKHDFEIFPPDTAKIYYEEELPVFQEGKPLINKVDPYYDAEGARRWVNTNKWPVFGEDGKTVIGIFGISRDITDQKAAEEIREELLKQKILAETNQERATLLENMIDGFVLAKLIYDDRAHPIDFSVIDANASFCEMIGVQDPTGKKGSELANIADHPATELIIKFGRIASGSPAERFEVEIPSLNTWFSVAAFSQRSGQLAALFTDISARKQLLLGLSKEKAAAENTSRLKSRFLDIAAHELRTPVTAFSLLLQITEKQLQKGIPVESETIARLRRQTDRLSSLVIDLLDVSRLERGLTLKKQFGDIVPLISECLDIFRLQAPSRSMTFHHPGHAVEANFDRERVFQVLSNIIDNAIKYTPSGSRIDIELEEATDRIRVLIKDRGPGISQSKLHAVFGAFERGSTDTEERAGGLGLGLFICKRIMELHGGKIGVTSQAGSGSTFYFDLPRNGPTP